VSTSRPRRPSRRRPLRLEGLEDRCTPALTLSITPGGFIETAGPSAATGTITRTGATTNPLTVSLLSSDPSEATVPATVTILAGQASAAFPIAAADDAAADGTQRVRITAWADGPTPTGTVAYDPAFRRAYTSAVFSVYALAVQPDGRILSAAWGNSTHLTVTRHRPDGTPDPTFGSGGVASVAGTGFPPSSIAVAPDDKIVIARRSSVLTRLRPNGSLDNSFGTTGNVAVNIGGIAAELHAVAVQPDGKVVVAGWYTNPSNTREAMVLRYNTDGTPDATFGTGGVAHVTTYSGGDAAYGLTLLPDGKVVVLGTTYTSNSSMLFAARFTPAGAPDPTWGNTGAVTLDIHTNYDIASAAVVQPDGKLVVAANTGVVRYNPDGSKDVTFGQFGVYAITPYQGLDSSTRLARLPDGRLVYGNEMLESVSTAKLILLSPDGVQESTAVLSSTDRSYFDGGMALGADGSVYVGVDTFTSPTTTEDRLERFVVTVPPIALATLDVFDDDPLPPPVSPPTPVTLNLTVSPGAVSENAGAGAATGTVTRSGPVDAALVVSLRSSDTTEASVISSVMIPAGQASATFPIAAMDDAQFDGTQRPTITAWAGTANPEGVITRDTSFLPPFPSDSWSAGATTVQPDGKVVSVGRTANARTRLVRHLPDGTLDPTFGVNGVADVWISAEFDSPTAILVQPDGRIVVGGSVFAPQSIDIVLARFNPDGSLDPTFGVSGRVGLDLGPDQGSQLFDLVLLPDGKILAGGNVRVRDNDSALAVLRFNPDGSLDATYGVGGRAVIDVTNGRDYGYAMALQPDGKVVLVGQATYSNVFLPTVTLVRFTADGQPDATFGYAGRVQTDLRSQLDEAATDVALQADGKIVISVVLARSGTTNPVLYDLGVVRYLSDGTLDATFGQGGLVVYTSATAYIETRVAVLPDGRILLAGQPSQSGTIGLVRYSPTGTIEASNFTARSTTVGELVVLPNGTAYLFGVVNSTNTVYLDKFAAGGPPTGRAVLEVLDNESPPVSPPPPPPPAAGPAAFHVALTVSPITVRENGGANAATATVTRSGTPLTDALVVSLVSNRPDLVTVPATVTIPAGQASATFAVSVIDDAIWTGPWTVTITATTAGSSVFAPDPSFGTGGFRDLPADIGWSQSGLGLALMPDGRVVVAGASTSSTAVPSWVVFRTLPDGRPDNSFGVAGTVVSPFPNALPGMTGGDANAVVVQPDGKVIVVGTANGGFLPADDWVIARYNPNGTLDTAFGNGGFFRYEMPTDRSAWLYDVALQPDGKIVVTGSGTFNFAVARLTADGQLDPTFGVGGVATHDVGPAGSQQYPTTLAVQADGKILVAGWTSTTNTVRVARLNADGSLDSTYGVGGVAVLPVAGGRASVIAIQPDGKALVAGYGHTGGGRSDWMLARITTGGAPDPTFSGDGVSLLEFTGESDTVNDLAVLPDGRILVGGVVAVGANNSRMAFARYLPDGRLDPSFGRGGTYTAPASGIALNEVYALAVQADGRILAVTDLFTPGVRLGRFWPGTGSLPATASVTVLEDEAFPPTTLTVSINPTSFTETGGAIGTVTRTGDLRAALVVSLSSSDTTEATVPATVTIPAGQTTATFGVSAANDALLDGPQSVTITATASASSPEGTITRDATFNLGAGRSVASYRSVMALAADGTVILVGTRTGSATGNGTDISVARLFNNGTRDTTLFGYQGNASFDVTGQADTPEAVLVLPDDRILIAGTGLNGPATALFLVRLLPDGLVDLTFGTEGRTLLGGPGGTTWVVRGIAVQPDGKILVSGSADGVMAVARFLPDGTPDGTFGTAGTALAPFGGAGLGYAIAVQPDGKIVLGGEVFPGTTTAQFAVTRFNANGTLDPTFGMIVVEITGGAEGVREMVLQPDGKIVLGGPLSRAGTSPLLYDVALIRLNPDGNFDTGFGAGGAVITPIGGTIPTFSLGLLPDGRLLAAFTQTSATGTTPQARLLRYSTAGTLEVNHPSQLTPTILEQVIVRGDGYVYLLYTQNTTAYVERYRGQAAVTAQASVEVRDDEPFAQTVGDAYSVAEDTRLVVAAPAVRGNDVFRPDAPAMTAEVVTGPAHGTLTLGADGRIDYMPDPNYFGPDSFTYRLVATGFASNAATVALTVTPVNDAPTAVGDAFTVRQGDTLTVGPPVGVAGDNSLVMTSEPGDFVGGGRNYNFGPNSGIYTLNGSPFGAVIGFTGTTPGVWWNIWLAAPLGQTFIPGTTYPGSGWNQRNETDAAISISGEGRGTSEPIFGELRILQAEYDPHGFPTRFAASFVQRSGSRIAPALRGEVHFNYLPGPWGVRANDTDIEPDYLTTHVVTGPANGTLVLNPDGTLRYVPNVGFSGTDSFTYRVFDGALYSDPTTTTITVTPTSAATAGNDTFEVSEDRPLWIGPDMAAVGEYRLTMVSAPGEYVGAGRSYDYAPPTFAFTSRTYRPGQNMVEVYVRDPNNTSDYWHLDFAAPEGSPLLSGFYTGAQRWPFNDPGRPGMDVSGQHRGNNTLVGGFTVRQLVWDEAGNPVRFAADWVQNGDFRGTILHNYIPGPFGVLLNDADPDGDAVTAELVSGPSHGTLRLNPDGSFRYAPNPDFVGTDSFTYRARDGGRVLGAPATVTLNVNPVNDAPRFTPGSNVTVAEDAGPQTVPGWATGIAAGPPDESGQAVTFEIVGNTNPAMFAAGPAVAADGTLSFTLAADANGSAAIQVRARDDGGTFNGGVDVSEPRTFTIAATAVPDVVSVVVNGGAAQRSRVTELEVTFDMEVDATQLATAFALTRPADGAVVGAIGVTTRVEGGRTIATLTFSGANTDFGSLADGRWVLAVDRTKVRSLTGVQMAADQTAALHRLYGDVNGDAAVNGFDYSRFRTAYGATVGSVAYRADLDFNGDGAINGFDYSRFRTRYGVVLP